LSKDWFHGLSSSVLLESLLNDQPTGKVDSWLRTTGGAVTLLVCLQLVTGLLLAFYYVPSAETAHTTVAYLEKVAPAGSWIRALHHYGSQWLPVALAIHIAQSLWRRSYRRRPVGWWVSIALLFMVLAEGATGYSLPWDVRAMFATRITEGIAGGLPLVGRAARQWVLGGSIISPVTLARFFALHALLFPFLILLSGFIRFVFAGLQKREGESAATSPDWIRTQFARNMIVAGVVFLALALYAMKYNAPLGPPVSDADADYMPRPGPQFLWLFQLLKLIPGSAASLAATVLPALVLLSLTALPFFGQHGGRKAAGWRAQTAPILLSLVLVAVAALTVTAYLIDARDPQIRSQLELQSQQEREFRAQPFQPLQANSDNEPNDDTSTSVVPAPTTSPVASPAPVNAQPVVASGGSPPNAYLENCAACHGMKGEGTSLFPKLKNVTRKPRRSVEDLIGIMNDPKAYGLRPPMKSYADKLTDQEKTDIASWIAALSSTSHGKQASGR
jgi:ubiquinol-cytochrome c reductase cytochrome b subunit